MEETKFVDMNTEGNGGNNGVHNAFKRPRGPDEECQSFDEFNEHKKAKFTSQIPACLRILLPSKDAGPIIGKSGLHIKSLRENYNASVLLPDCSGPERILIVSTTLANACSILVEVIKTIETADKDVGLKVLVHQSQAGAIIGRNGSNIKEFREKYKVMIKVYPECAPMSSERVVEIRGRPEVVANTVYSLVEFLQTSAPIGPVYPYDPINFDESFALDYGGFTSFDNRPPMNRGGMRGSFRGPSRMPRGHHQAPFHKGRVVVEVPPEEKFGCDLPRRGHERGAPGRGMRGAFQPVANKNRFECYSSFEDEEATSTPKQNVFPTSGPLMAGQQEEVEVSQVTIPSELAGSIIGRGGARIKQIRSDSGALIDIDDPHPGTKERIITIKGTSEQIHYAQYLLQTSVKKYSGKY